MEKRSKKNKKNEKEDQKVGGEKTKRGIRKEEKRRRKKMEKEHEVTIGNMNN